MRMRHCYKMPGCARTAVLGQINLYFFQYLMGALRWDKISERKLNIIAIYKA